MGLLYISIRYAYKSTRNVLSKWKDFRNPHIH